jgi:alkanesulfonate monooxygenase SsuD/methylene tetrahydromethanopterin reductase-like flavin-dependent oxidoreductase (luciferase family)
MNAEAQRGTSDTLDYGHALPRTQWGRPRVRQPRASRPSEEAVAVVRAMWSDERRGLRFDGSHYQLAGVHLGPAPAHPIQVWIGANQPRALALTGRSSAHPPIGQKC